MFPPASENLVARLAVYSVSGQQDGSDAFAMVTVGIFPGWNIRQASSTLDFLHAALYRINGGLRRGEIPLYELVCVFCVYDA